MVELELIKPAYLKRSLFSDTLELVCVSQCICMYTWNCTRDILCIDLIFAFVGFCVFVSVCQGL